MPTPHWLRVQLSGPRGVLARPMAHLLNRFNGGDYRRAMAELAVDAGETVLELGFGGGVGVDRLLARGVKVLASEPSEAMRARGFRKWSLQLARGKIEIWPHAAEDLPSRSVDRALSMNTVYFWRDIELGFCKLAAMVEKRVVLGIAGPDHLAKAGFDQEGFRLETISWYEERLAAAGFETSVVPAPDEHHCGLLIGDHSRRPSS